MIKIYEKKKKAYKLVCFMIRQINDRVKFL